MERNDTHWHVANGTPGYLFDSDEPATFESRSEATEYARNEARDERDQRNDAARWIPDGNGGFTTVPLARDETWSANLRVGRNGPFVVSINRNRNPHSLPYNWEGWECSDTHED